MKSSEVTLVTGASSGIGYGLARRLPPEGDRVVLLARRRDALDALAETIRGDGGRALAVVADVTDRQALEQAVAQAKAEFGPITRLIANAGGGQPTFIETYDAATIEQTIQLNLIGVANAVGAVLPDMRQHNAGHLVAMGSLAAARGLPSAAAYSAAKAGVANFMQSLAVDLVDTGIDVTLLEPGFVAKAGARRRRLRMSMTVATHRMVAAIQARRAYWRGPPVLVFAAIVLRLLPYSVYNRLMAGRGRGPRT